MQESPEYIKIDDKKYKINTDFKVALRCNQISKDENICDYEKTLAIIFLLFGEEALKDIQNYDKLINLAIKYLNCGEELTTNGNETIDMDFTQDYSLIKASFKTDYGIDIDKENLTWYDFYTYLNGLKEDCVLNRVRNLRTFDTKDLNGKEKEQIEYQKRKFALKDNNEVHITEKQKESAEKFYKLTGIKRRVD